MKISRDIFTSSANKVFEIEYVKPKDMIWTGVMNGEEGTKV